MSFLHTVTVVSSFDELNCREFSKIWPTPNYWSQKINLCLSLQTCQLVRLLTATSTKPCCFLEMCLQYGSAAALDTTAEAKAHPSGFVFEWSLSKGFAFLHGFTSFSWFYWVQPICALDKKLGLARGVLVGWPSVVNSKEKLTSKQSAFQLKKKKRKKGTWRL